VTKFFKTCGWRARRQPGSGIYSGFPHDNQVESPGSSLNFNIECKARKAGLKTIQGWLGKADMLVIKPNHEQPYFILTERAMQDLLSCAAEWEPKND
jgi:hypothetical protein